MIEFGQGIKIVPFGDPIRVFIDDDAALVIDQHHYTSDGKVCPPGGLIYNPSQNDDGSISGNCSKCKEPIKSMNKFLDG